MDSTSLYWASATGAVTALAKTGGTPTILANAANAFVLAVDDTNVYWIGPPTAGKGAISTVAKSGGAATKLADMANRVDRIAVDATSVYWTGADVGKVPKAGGPPTILAQGINDGRVIAVGPRAVYTESQMRIIAVPIGGGPWVETPAGGGPTVLALDDAALYWAVDFERRGALMRLPLCP
jgi:hypothetical protein